MPLTRLRTVVAAALLATGLLFGTTAPATASVADSADSQIADPPGANDWSCRPSAAHPNPVVLVHGTFANQYENWLVLSPLLKSKGYCVYALTYGLTGDSWTSTGSGIVLPIGGLRPVAESAAQLATFVDRVRASTGAAKVDIVGHSQGGMMPRYYLKFLGGAAKVDKLVGLAPSNHGTTLSGIANLADHFPGIAQLVYTACPACQDQVVGSATLTKLNAGGDTVPGVRYTVISTWYDQVVTPYRTQFLSGPDVANRVVQDSCPVAIPEHVAMAFSPTALHHVTNALDPAHATPVFCG
ncbi:lipase [Longispora fulva]|uniref:Triacylglycerol esterase/lipase EstA (Alpha/beta hydrolase family) n=1 Tax=Longispora fulva TaxID=619741 RepID=A0A8J7KVB9_9ACTN|nr:alpha/beta fold hydrolase [Longispora fulva]MBG6135122.1 triacylglycerol esterase/lipase EstA (alpha/beta hydrolase family) [Longispora fulva]GIG56643.1 lipase [Longispora fulva]